MVLVELDVLDLMIRFSVFSGFSMICQNPENLENPENLRYNFEVGFSIFPMRNVLYMR